MNRRALLGALGGSGVVATAGCLGDGGTALASVPFGADADPEREYTVSGTIVAQTPLGVVFDDGTELAQAAPKDHNYALDPDVFPVGECIELTGTLDLEESRHYRRPVFDSTDEGAGVGLLGHNCVDAAPLGPPDVSFRVGEDEDPRDQTKPVVFDGGPDSVAAGEVLVRHREEGADASWLQAEQATWSDLTDVGPEEAIPVGSRIDWTGQRDLLVHWVPAESYRSAVLMDLV